MPAFHYRLLTHNHHLFLRRTYCGLTQRPRNMGKKKNVPPEELLILPPRSSNAPIVDTHTHLVSTYSWYRSKYPQGKFETVHDFVKGVYSGSNVKAIVDVYCEAPVQKVWKELADSALSLQDRAEKWGGVEYWFVMGVHPHEAKLYNDEVEKDMRVRYIILRYKLLIDYPCSLEAMTHPRCVGWGEMGLDYHYDNSPREIQREIFTRQLKHAVRLGKSLTIHTREADEDTERILKENVPRDHKIHIHCFTDSPDFGQRLLDHFPNLHIGITGVATFSTNEDTPEIFRRMVKSNPEHVRFVLETDAPYMIPANIYDTVKMKGRFPLCHTAMIPWTADFIANIAGEGWDADKILRIGRDNARIVYGV